MIFHLYVSCVCVYNFIPHHTNAGTSLKVPGVDLLARPVIYPTPDLFPFIVVVVVLCVYLPTPSSQLRVILYVTEADNHLSFPP